MLKNYLEGNTSEDYLAHESLFYFCEMLAKMNPFGIQVWNEDMMPKPKNIILPKTRTRRKLGAKAHKQVHLNTFVVDM